MQISSKHILSSAESILRDRKQEMKNAALEGGSVDRQTKAGHSVAITQSAMEAKLLHLQDSLRNVQRNLSREQARHSYLSEHPSEVSPSLLFDGAPLFPELAEGQTTEQIKNGVLHQMELYLHNLKSLQVEMENLHALQFDSAQPDLTSRQLADSTDTMKRLDPERVARLTRS